MTVGVWVVKVKVALLTALCTKPAALAIALIVVFVLTEIGPA